MRVIVAYWAWHLGRADDAERFDAMWDGVIETYGGEDLVYFEIFTGASSYLQAPRFPRRGARTLSQGRL